MLQLLRPRWYAGLHTRCLAGAQWRNSALIARNVGVFFLIATHVVSTTEGAVPFNIQESEVLCGYI